MNPRLVYFLSVFFSTIVLLLFIGFSSDLRTGLRSVASYSLEVQQVHISLGSEPFSVNIAWVLKKPAETCYVQLTEYSLYNPDVVELSYTGYEGGLYRSFVYNVTASHLEPGLIYPYKVNCMIDGVWEHSRFYEFVGPSTFADQISVISIADMSAGGMSDPFDNYSKLNRATILKFLLEETSSSRKYDALLHTGDFAYDLNSLNGTLGDRFMNSMEPVVARVPYMTTTGNHESHTNFSHYSALFKTPGDSLHYSFDYGPVHFVMMDSEAFVGRFTTDKKLEDHLAWVEKDLAETSQPWIVVLSHRPIYCNPNPDCKVCTNSCTKYSVTMARHLEDLLNRHRVALYVSADVHLYERSTPVYRNESAQTGKRLYKNPPAPVYIVNGVAGNFDREAEISSIKDRMKWNVVADDRLGWGVLTANRTHLGWKQFAVGKSQLDDPEWLDRQKPVVIDEFWIVKDSS